MNNPVDFLLEFLRKFDEGRIFLPFGTHVHKIHTKSQPFGLWFSEVNSGDVPVCQGSINMYGFTLTDDGFILYANVMSDTVELEWQAILDPML